ncbi:MAG: type IVB secretion system protein IcmJDotN [Gammaproteobacteria bacterium]|nr:type IVB secretion system protein IcmJDotN [Gammaproteobacteria bacterium]
MYPIELSAASGAWRLFAVRKVDSAFLDFANKIFVRDNHTCQFCGFQAKQYQEVINLDNNYLNNKTSNLVTACCFCAQCFFLEAVGKSDHGGGTLIYLPEMTQNELNSLCHVLFCAISNATDYRTDAQNVYRTFKMRSKLVEQQLGEGMHDPALLGQMLIDADMKERKKITTAMLKDLRLLPSQEKFSEQIRAWARAALDELSQ